MAMKEASVLVVVVFFMFLTLQLLSEAMGSSLPDINVPCVIDQASGYSCKSSSDGSDSYSFSISSLRQHQISAMRQKLLAHQDWVGHFEIFSLNGKQIDAVVQRLRWNEKSNYVEAIVSLPRSYCHDVTDSPVLRPAVGFSVGAVLSDATGCHVQILKSMPYGVGQDASIGWAQP